MTSIEPGAFDSCTALKSITIPEGVTSIERGAFKSCTALKSIKIPKETKNISDDAFKDSGIEKIYVDQNRTVSPIRANQAWGANTKNVFYKGEFVNIDTTVEKVEGEYARNINLEVYIDKKKYVNKIVMPNGKVVNIGDTTWKGKYKVDANGTYIFKGYDDSGNEVTEAVTIDDIGKPIVSAKNATIDYAPKKITKEELIKLLKASAIDELDKSVPVEVSDQDLEKVRIIKNGETVEVTVKAIHPISKLTASKKVSVTYVAAPDIVPGNQEKPKGYVTVTFEKGEHGKLEGLASYHVNPEKEVDLKEKAPKVIANIGFKHTGWDKALKAKFTEPTTITATYKALPDIIPGNEEKPKGYVTVTFEKGEHGKLEGLASYHVNPEKEVDLKEKAPKVIANIGFKHTGWDKALKAKFAEPTTITATYEAIADNKDEFVIKIDPNGGKWIDGDTNPKVYKVKKGNFVELPEAPTREGYIFKYWKGSEYQPGDKYKVEGDHTFVAFWEKADQIVDNKQKSHSPFTGDNDYLAIFLIMSILSLTGLIKMRVQKH